MTPDNTCNAALAKAMIKVLDVYVCTNRPKDDTYVDALEVLMQAVDELSTRSSLGLEVQALITSRLEGCPYNAWLHAYVREGLQMLECVLD